MRYIYSRASDDRSQSLAGWLLSLNPRAVTALYVQSGYFSDGGLDLIKPLMEGVKKNGGEVMVVVGANDKGTSEDDARALLKAVKGAGGRCGVCAYGGALFHPKVICAELQGGESVAYVGSANLTEQGAVKNLEAALTLSTREGDAREVLDEIKGSTRGWFEGGARDGFYELSDEVIERLLREKILGEGRTWRAGPVDGEGAGGRKRGSRAGRTHALKPSELKEELRRQRALLKSAPSAPVEVEPTAPAEPKPSASPAPAEPKPSASPAPAEPKPSASATKRAAAVKPHSTLLPSAAGEVVTASVRGVEFKMSYCPPGEFWMGSQAGVGYDDERPRHRVKLSRGFWMGQTQVTQALWEKVMGSNPSHFKGATLPVENISWYDAVRFCNALSGLDNLQPVYGIGTGDRPTVSLDPTANGYRLPTEAQWEYAAKAGTELTYAGSDTLDAVAWHSGNAGGRTHPVGEKAPNAWGIYDMSGNVWEWCADQYDSNAYKSRSGTVTDPAVYAAGPSPRVSRGGSWWHDAGDCRVAFRVWNDADRRWGDLGVRLLRWNLDT